MWMKVEEVEELMFMGIYSHSIDTKGRMILPAKFREQLGAQFVLAPGLDTCLCIYTRERWDNLIAALSKLPFTNVKVRKIMRHLIGRSTEMECDKQGRVLIPASLRKFAELEKEAAIIGTGATIEIWNPAHLDEDENSGESMSEIADSLDLPLSL